MTETRLTIGGLVFVPTHTIAMIWKVIVVPYCLLPGFGVAYFVINGAIDCLLHEMWENRLLCAIRSFVVLFSSV